MTADQPLIQIEDLKKYFKVRNGFLHAVDGVTLSIPQAKTLGVVGESGCGKSTLGRLLLRLIEPTSGKIYFDGEDILQYKRDKMSKLRSEMQIIFQDPYSSLDPRKSVYEIIAETLIVNRAYSNRKEMEERIFYLMQTVGLAERFINSYPHEMDGGRRQRVGVARALAMNPKFIVCDEPVSALDVSIQAQILNLLMDLQEEMGYTYLFITHDLSVVKHISDEIAVMYLGQCVERATSRELFTNPLHPYTKALLAAIPEPKISRHMRQEIIKGEISDPINPDPGCRFAPRCSACREDCVKGSVELAERAPGHYIACRLYE